MSDIQSAAVKSLAEQIVKAINTITEKNNKNYVNARVTRYGGGGSSSSGGGSWSGTISPSQITGLYDVVSSYLIDAEENAAAGDETAIKIMSTLNGISDVRITNATIKSAQIDDLSSSYAEFIRLVSEKATIKEVDTEKVYAELADIGLSNINRADIGYAQIKDLSAGTAIFREGSGGKLYLDRLIVDDANIANLTAGKLMLQKDDGKFYQISVDDSGAVATTEVQVENENIKDATIGGAKILESAIGTRELNVDELTASTAFIGKLATSVISTPKFGDDIDLTNNSSITLLDSKIGLVVDSSSTSTELTLTDKALTAIADKVDLSGNESVTAKVKTEVTGAIDEKFPQQDTAPENPSEGDLWLDTGVLPNVLKIYKKDSTTQELGWNIVNDVDKSTLASRVTAAELKITDDAIVQTVTSSSSYSGLVDRVSTAESKLTDSAMETTIANSEALSDVKQTADKINWVVASGTSASTMQMTDEAMAVISDNVTISSGNQITAEAAKSIDLSANETVSIKSAGQISADAAKSIDLAANETISIKSSKQITAEAASGIDLSANTTVKITSAGQISAEASKGIDISSNESITLLSGKVSTIEGDISSLEDDAIYDSADVPATVKTGMKWLDRGVTPAVLRRWTGAVTTPAGNTMTTDREIAEDTTGTSITLYNANNLIKSRLDVMVESSSASKVTVTYGGETQTVALTNGSASIKLKAGIADGIISTTATSMDVSYICSGWETINDTSDLEDDLLETANTTTNTYNKVEGALELTDDGVRVGRRINGETTKRSVLIHSSGMDICTNNVATSEFRDDYIKLLGMQIRIPSSKGGLIISAAE